MQKSNGGLLIIVMAFVSAYWVAGCTKDYSYERGARDSVRVSLPLPDSTTPPQNNLTSCSECKAAMELSDSQWVFVADGAVFCGVAEKSIITLERTSFTFFGPSACSADSGFIASVYLNEPLTTSAKNVGASRVAFYYYDRITPSYPLMSATGSPFKLTIENYDKGTGLATGTFNGDAFTPSGIRKSITGGRFRIRIN